MVANAWAGSHTTFLSFIVLLTLDCEYESSGFLTASNDDDLDLSTIAVFHVTGLLLQLYFHSQYWRFGASCWLASIFYCMLVVLLWYSFWLFDLFQIVGSSCH